MLSKDSILVKLVNHRQPLLRQALICWAPDSISLKRKRMYMGLIVFGQSKMPIGVDQVLCPCRVCEKDTWSDLMVESVYLHLYYLPIFPVDKLANLICEECGNKRYGLEFNSKLIPTYEEIKSKFRHPMRSFLLSAILGALILIATIVSTIGNKS